jgi:hypothetical protein
MSNMFFRKKQNPQEPVREADMIETESIKTEPFPEPPKIEEKEPHTEEYAPLFVKVEKYRDILRLLGEIRSFISGLKQLFVVISEIEGIRDDAMKIMRATVSRLEKAAAEIDAELLRPVGLEPFPAGEIELKHIETSLSDLQRQLAALRDEVEKLGK